MDKLREWIAIRLVRLARWVQPENKEYLQFMTDRMVEFIASGRSTIKVTSIDPIDMYEPISAKPKN